MAAKKIVVPDQGENWCRQQCRRHKETIDVSCILPNSSPTQRQQQNDSILEASNIVNIVNGTISAMSRSIWRISI